MDNSPSDFELTVSAYQESCDRNNLTFYPPIEEHSQQINDVIYLRTGSTGYVARYDTRRRQMLA
ncbi:MAG: hypothetical protein AAF215_10200 [Cyanobacteria bacterium P01_A01_bin.123]